MKLYSISETTLQVASTLLLICVARSIMSWTRVRHVCNWKIQRTCYLCAPLSESTWENFILFKNTTSAISPTKLDLHLVFILGENATTDPNIFFPVCHLTFPSLTIRRLVILCYLWLSSEFLSTWPFYMLLSRSLCWKRPTLSTLLCHVFQNLFYLCLFITYWNPESVLF